MLADPAFLIFGKMTCVANELLAAPGALQITDYGCVTDHGLHFGMLKESSLDARHLVSLAP